MLSDAVSSYINLILSVAQTKCMSFGYLIFCRPHRAGAYLQLPLGTRWGTPWTVLQSNPQNTNKTTNHTLVTPSDKLKVSVNLKCVFLVSEKKPEHLGKHATPNRLTTLGFELQQPSHCKTAALTTILLCNLHRGLVKIKSISIRIYCTVLVLWIVLALRVPLVQSSVHKTNKFII